MRPAATSIVLLAGLLAPATAASLAIDGVYGDERGCAFAKKPEYTGENDFMLLTQTEWRTAVTACDFVRVDAWESQGLKRFVVTGLCASEGEGETTIDLLRIEKAADGSDAYVVYNASGNEIGKGQRCP